MKSKKKKKTGSVSDHHDEQFQKIQWLDEQMNEHKW